MLTRFIFLLIKNKKKIKLIFAKACYFFNLFFFKKILILIISNKFFLFFKIEQVTKRIENGSKLEYRETAID